MKTALTIFLGFFALATSAQNYIDIARFSYGNTPLNTFDNTSEKTKVEEFGLQLTFPIVINEKTVILTGISADRSRLKLNPDFTDHTALNKMRLQLGLNQVHSEKWNGTYVLLPSIASDFELITKKDFQIGLLTLLTYTKNKNLKYKFGFYANTEKYGQLLVPLLGLYYLSPNQKFESTLLLPGQADFNYQLAKKTALGVNFDGMTSSYNLHESNYIPKGQYVVRSSNELYTYLQFMIGKSLVAKTKLGYSISRSYKVFNNDDKVDLSLASFYFGDDRTQLNSNFEKGAIFKLELLYRVHFK
ncbi:MAG: DUF6268 family outer membrane beta-barrel protein [Lutibacter sp.]|nr:DUF6268 family outer membrane beta-barrel protein [Lutibacter sp.]MDT8417335.1 DUF6268 family outer membrane beta-barrel protein [Lutibacter sp.]